MADSAYNTQMRYVLLPIFFLVLALGPGNVAYGRGAEDGIYVYDLFREADNCLVLFTRLRHLALRPTVILSIEQGPDYLLDHPTGASRLHCVLSFLNGSGKKVKALFLQDPVFLERGAEVERRAKQLGDFIERHPEDLAGVQVNVEPHADQRWADANAAERKQMVDGLTELLDRVHPHAKGLPLSVVTPWWYAHIAAEIQEASPTAMFEAADEVYVMAYGDEEAEPTTKGSPEGSSRARLGGAFAFAERGPTHIILATHEFSSRRNLENELQKLRKLLASSPYFAGTAVFHATSDFLH